MSGVAEVALAGLAWTVSLALLTWVVSLVRHDASLVDRMWPVFIVGAGLVYFALLPVQTVRGLWMAVLGTAWAVRLCLYITWRNWGHGEDRRYQAIRARNQPNFGFRSLYLVFALQAVLAWIVSAPFLPGMLAARPLGVLDVLGVALALFGIFFEAIGDAQMARFRADPKNAGQVMDRGLWRYTRHPNYFGEACVWWGIWLMAMGGAGWSGAWSVVSPLLMTWLLLKVSGVRMLEADIGERRPAYREYIARTNAFVPGPVRRWHYPDQ
jgi:steroid 5-alpha reductase family enzyme